jgi:hypothetical protein
MRIKGWLLVRPAGKSRPIWRLGSVFWKGLDDFFFVDIQKLILENSGMRKKKGRLVWKIRKSSIFAATKTIAGVAQLVEHDLAKVGVAGPSPVSRSISPKILFFLALVVELVDTQDLKSCGLYGRAGSIPARGTV